MKILSTSDYNSNNAWGFGGAIGKLTLVESSDGTRWRVLRGTCYYRHLKSSKACWAQQVLDTPEGTRFGPKAFDLHECKSNPGRLPADVFGFARTGKVPTK